MVPLLPLLCAILAVGAVGVGAASWGQPFPIDVAGVLLLVGAAAVVMARGRPWRGALFVAVLASVVVAVLYGG